MEKTIQLPLKNSNFLIIQRVPIPYLSKNSPDDRLIFLSFTYHNGKEELALWRNGPGRPDPSEE